MFPSISPEFDPKPSICVDCMYHNGRGMYKRVGLFCDRCRVHTHIRYKHGDEGICKKCHIKESDSVECIDG